jgi:DNA primase
MCKTVSFTRSVVFSFDGDNAGRRARRGAGRRLPFIPTCAPSSFVLAERHDDSYIRERGQEGFAGASKKRCQLTASCWKPYTDGCDLVSAETAPGQQCPPALGLLLAKVH